MINQYLNAQASIFARTRTLANSLIGVSPDLEVFKFDAAGDTPELPENDLIGPYKFTVVNEDGLLVVTTQIVVSTLNDQNLFRLDEIVNTVFDAFSPGSRHPLIDAKDGSPLGLLVSSDETVVLPVERAASRPVKSIAIELRSDRASPRS